MSAALGRRRAPGAAPRPPAAALALGGLGLRRLPPGRRASGADGAADRPVPARRSSTPPGWPRSCRASAQTPAGLFPAYRIGDGLPGRAGRLGAPGGRPGGPAASPSPPRSCSACPGRSSASATTAWRAGRRWRPGTACGSRRWRAWSARTRGRGYVEFRSLRGGLLLLLGPRQRPPPADHPGLRHERRAAAAGVRRAAAPLLGGEARLQDGEVPLGPITFLPTRTGGYWEDQGYEWFAGV